MDTWTGRCLHRELLYNGRHVSLVIFGGVQVPLSFSSHQHIPYPLLILPGKEGRGIRGARGRDVEASSEDAYPVERMLSHLNVSVARNAPDFTRIADLFSKDELPDEK